MAPPLNARPLYGLPEQRQTRLLRTLLRPLPSLEVLHRRIPTPSQGRINPLQHEIVDFDPLIEGNLPQCLIDRLRQVQAGVYDGWSFGRRTGRAGWANSFPW
jgi:hypothetical protein